MENRIDKNNKNLFLLFVIFSLVVLLFLIPRGSATTQCDVACKTEYYEYGACGSSCTFESELGTNCPDKCCCYNPSCVVQHQCWEHRGNICYYLNHWQWGHRPLTEIVCDDGFDNDCDDGYGNFDSNPNTGVDCDDLDCINNPYCQEEYNCVRINGTNYCCGDSDNVCPEDFEDSANHRINCDPFGGDVDCEPVGVYCGNNMIEPPEKCDGTNLSGKTCQDFGYTGGILSCLIDCTNYDFSQCTGLIVDCKITEAKIKTYCGAGGCDNGDKVELNITVEDMAQCKNVNKIEIDAFSDAQSQPTGMVIGGSFCSVYMTNSFPILSPAENRYLGNWTVIVPSGCQGKTVDADTARLFNETGMIAQKPGNFGSFDFVNDPTNWYVLEDISVSPSYFVLNITDTQQLEVTALMKWVKNNSFFTLDVTEQSIYDSNNLAVASVSPLGLVTGIGDGTANITAEYTHYGVTKEDSGIVNVRYFEDDYIIYINLILGKYEIEVDEETSYHVEAYWSNTTTSDITIQPGVHVQSLNPSVASVQNYKVKGESQGITIINSSYTHNNLPYGDEKFIIVTGEAVGCFCDNTPCGQCYDPTSECVDDNGIGKIVPCQLGWACNDITGKCELLANPDECYQNQTLCHDVSPFGSCYWDLQPIDLCKHCLEDDPGSCSGYDNEIACNADPCSEKYTGCPSGSTCECMWDTSLGECYLNVQQQGEPGSGICCDYSVSFGECDSCDGQTNSRRRTTTCEGPCQSGDQCEVPIDCALTGYTGILEDCQSCATIYRRLPFFSWFNVLAVVSLLVVFYIFMLRKKKIKLNY